jgi:dephospho-CoA kinase
MTSPPRKIALTGGIACGKSLAGEYLRQKGIPVIDADDVVHQLLRGDEVLKARIRAEFGPEVFTPEGYVDRPKLGQRIFGASPETVARRKLLESWIHPETRTVIDQFYLQNASAPLGVSIIPLLFESALENRYDEIWLLQTSEAIQLDRLLQNRGMTYPDAVARIKNQMSPSDKAERARQHPCHAIIDNNGDPENLYRQLAALLTSAAPP